MLRVFEESLTQLLAVPWYAAVVALLLLASAVVLVANLRQAGTWFGKSLLAVTAVALLLTQILFLLPGSADSSGLQQIVVTPCPEPEQLAAIAMDAAVVLVDDSEQCASVAAWLDGARERGTGMTVRAPTLGLAPVTSRTVSLLGDGLRRDDLAGQAAERVRWSPPTARPAPVRLQWPDTVMQGERPTVQVMPVDGWQGRIEITGDDPESPALAAIDITGDDAVPLALPAMALGSYLLRLRAFEGDDTFERRIPISVQAPPLARVLLLQSSPAFEWRTLQRMLSDSGSALIVRSTVSLERVQWSMVNVDRQQPDLIDSGLLSAIDLVIADIDVLNTLLPSERVALLAEDRRHGLLFVARHPVTIDALPSLTRAVLRPGSGDRVLYQFPAEFWSPDSAYSRIDAVLFGQRTVLADLSGQPLVVVDGKVPALGVSLVRDSYRLQAAGYDEDYSRLWSRLVSAMATPLRRAAAQVMPKRSELGRRVQLCLPVEEAVPALVTLDGRAVAGLEFFTVPWRAGLACAWFWPDRSGWLRARSTDGRGLVSHWIAPAGYWQPTRRLDNRTSTQASLSKKDSAALPSLSKPSREMRLYLLLLAALSHWLLQRLVTTRRL
ncbi:MAG: hypothetical protein AAF290_02065 [Pseudomonadota bacterium]